jgi:signal transduction histidine kinase
LPHILLVDATPAALTLLQGTAESGFVLIPAESAERALELARAQRPEVAVVDAELAGGPGFCLAANLKAAVPEMEIVIVTAHASLDAAIGAFKVGAFDYLPKPLDATDLLLKVANAMEKVRLKREQQRLEEERSLLEAHLREAAKMDSLGRLAGGIAHDFNNILTVISSNAELLLLKIPTDDPRRRRAEEIQAAADRATGLTRQLLEFGRRKPVQPEPLDLNEVVREIDQLLTRLIGQDVEQVRRLAVDLWRTRADRDQLGQVILNLAVNARDAMSKGGRLTIETANAGLQGRPAAESGLGPGRYVVLSVSDNGCGMSRETLARIFEPLFTTKPPGKGTGLGLATVYGIVSQAGGSVRVTSELGVGSTFRVFLPALE